MAVTITRLLLGYPKFPFESPFYSVDDGQRMVRRDIGGPTGPDAGPSVDEQQRDDGHKEQGLNLVAVILSQPQKGVVRRREQQPR